MVVYIQTFNFLYAILKMGINEIRVQEMLMYIFIVSCALNMSCASDIMTNLWDEDIPLRKALMGDSVSDEESKVLIRRLSKVKRQLKTAVVNCVCILVAANNHQNVAKIVPWRSNLAKDTLPFTDQVKSDAWFKILRYRRVENLDLMDWQRYEPLIPNLPISMLRQVNFSDDFILSYFGQQKLKQIQLSQLAEEVTMRIGDVLDDEEKILKLGNIFCGFSPDEITTIKDSTLRSLLERNFFQSIKACSIEQLGILTKLMKQYTVIGPPKTWQPETVKKVGNLIAGLGPHEIREIRERSFSQISSEVIALIPIETLREMKDSQLKALNRSALLTWRRKTRDLRGLYMGRSSGHCAKISFVTLVTAFLFVN